MTAVQITLTVQLDGVHAADVADDLAIDIEGGELDQAALNMLRAHLAADGRDWKIVHVLCDIEGAQVTDRA